MESPEAYIPIDRRLAIARGDELPDRAWGSTLFADISGFTPLTEALVRALGPQRGAEELPRQLNLIYDALIAEVDRFGGSVLGFAGDAITCWFAADDGLRATACAFQMQQAMAQFASVPVPGGGLVSLAIKVAVATGPVRRFLVGDPEIQTIDVLAGATLDHLAAGEHHAEKGDVVLDSQASAQLGSRVHVVEWRTEEETGDRFAVVGGLAQEVAPAPWPPLASEPLDDAQIRPWLLPPIYERLRSGLGEFLTELRPAVALFLRFGGIDYDDDDAAQTKLDAYIRWVQGVLARYGGYLLQLTIGDKGSYLYSAFGAPMAHGDDAVRAARAALELRAPPPELDFVQNVQIGISQGRMRTGAYGGPTRRTYGVLGDEVNMAARLMQNAPPGEVLVSQAAQKFAADAFTWESLPPLRVKGKSDPVTVFRLVTANERHAMRLQEPRYALPMVGREAELRLVEQKLAQVVAGDGQIVAVTAEAGMGKSRLVAEIIGLANTRQLAGYVGECQSYGTNSSYLVWQDIWQAFFGLDETAPLTEHVRSLEAQLAAIDPALVPRLPLLSVVLNLPIPDNDLTQSMDAKLRKASLEALLVDCVRARARNTPLLFVLEDCHWIDPLSHDLLEVIGRSITDIPVLIVIAYRPPQMERLEAPRVTQLPYCTIIRLTDFTPEEATRLIGLKLEQLSGPGMEPPASLVERLTERAQGNPFYIEELLNYIRDLGLDPRDPQALERLDLPTSLHTLILSRIDQLTETAKVTLKVASIIGRLFRFSWLWGVHPQLGESKRVKADLEALSRLDLTPEDQPEPEPVYVFKHIVTREVAYESLPYATRSLLHEHLGHYIEQEYHDAINQYLDLLAYHYDHSQNEPKKREYLLRAGEAAQAAYANTTAIDYFRRVLPLLSEAEQVDVKLKLGQVLELVSEWAEANDLYRQALKLAEQLDDLPAQAQGQSATAGLLMRQKRYAEAAPWLERARAAFEQLGDAAGISHVVTEIGEVYRLQGQYDAARARYDESLRLAEAVVTLRQRKAARAKALKAAGIAASQRGDRGAARSLWEEGLAILRELGDKPGIAALLNNLGMVAMYQEDYDTARPLYEESLALLRELGNKWAVAQTLNNLGLVARYQGDYTTARRLLEESLAIGRQLGDQWGIANSLSSLGEVALAQGDYTVARDFLEESLTLTQQLGDRVAIAYLLEYFGGLAAAQDEPERALRLAGAAAALREAIGAPLPPAEQAALERMLERAQPALGEGASASAWAEGRTMALEQAIEYALVEQAPA